MSRLPTVKEKMGLPENRDLEVILEPVIVKKIIKKEKIISKKADMDSRVDPHNLTYYN